MIGENLFYTDLEQKVVYIAEQLHNEKAANDLVDAEAFESYQYSMEDFVMFRKIRRIKNEITIEEAKALLRKSKRAALSVNGDDGYPYTIPINFYYDEVENRIYIHSAKKGHKIDSIQKNDKICFTTWDDGYLDDGDWAYHVSSCVIFGRARLVENQQITEDKVKKLALKYYPSAEEVEDEIKKGLHGVQLIEIEIEHISAKKVHER